MPADEPSASTPAEGRLERLVGMLRRRGVLFPAFEIHGGVTGLYDFGPLGARIKRRLADSWVEHWLSQGDIVEIDSPTVTPFPVLEASGHVGAFTDLLSTCRACGEQHRSDHLLGGIVANADNLSAEAIEAAITGHAVPCPTCGVHDWSPPTPLNLMFSTTIGTGAGGRAAFLRPETAQGMFTQFPVLHRHFREQLPFGALQTGRGYRNEISSRQGMIRLREFNMGELEYFIDPEHPPEHDLSRWAGTPMPLFSETLQLAEEASMRLDLPSAVDQGIIRHRTVAWFMGRTWDWFAAMGADMSRFRFRQHLSDEMAHYASDCWDVELHGSYGWIECVGVAHRGCYDLESHETFTGQRLRGWRTFDEPRQVSGTRVTANGAVTGPHFRGQAGAVKAALELLEAPPAAYPCPLELADGTTVEVSEAMVKLEHVDRIETGEWYLPHVIEPAFGFDRILWHLIDHAYTETEKEGVAYVRMALGEAVAPLDVVVLPLFEKGGMGELAQEVHAMLNATPGIMAQYDAAKSIGRRYARADEVGVPWAITVDHQSLEDGTVTVRRRDDQQQARVGWKLVGGLLRERAVDRLFE